MLHNRLHLTGAYYSYYESLIMDYKLYQVDQLSIRIYPDRTLLGLGAAAAVASFIREKQKVQPQVSTIFAAAPSQNEFLASLALQSGINWRRIIAFQMDEYVDLPLLAPQRFSTYLRLHLFDRVNPGRVEYLEVTAENVAKVISKYTSLLHEFPPDISCTGVGENGHLAYNDPPFARFDEPEKVKLVPLTQRSRQQQVNDGHFPELSLVPHRALTLTIPALLTAPFLSCVVPSDRKAEAIQQMLTGPITAECPASILRNYPRATLFLDEDSAGSLEETFLREREVTKGVGLESG
jgi:glucosamine-6-phosphate deaminase